MQATPKLPLAGSLDRWISMLKLHTTTAVPMQLPCRRFIVCGVPGVPCDVKRNLEEWPVAYVAWGDSRTIRVGRLRNLALIQGRLEGHMATKRARQ